MGDFNDGPRGNSGNFRGNRSGGGFKKRGFNDGPREMHKTTCSECKNECEVPFKPVNGKPVYCRECYIKKKEGSN